MYKVNIFNTSPIIPKDFTVGICFDCAIPNDV